MTNQPSVDLKNTSISPSERQNLLETAGCCFIALDETFKIQYIDATIRNLTGYPADSLIGKPFIELVPSGWKSKIQYWQQLEQHSHSHELMLRTRYGGYCWVQYTQIVAEDEEGFKVVLYDITPIKKQEESIQEKNNLLRTILDHIPIAINAKNPNGEYILSNANHLKLVGRNTETEVLGKTNRDLLPPSIALRNEKEDREVLKNGKTLLNEERPGLPGSGIRYMSTTKIPLKDEAGRITGILGMEQDITRSKQQELELKRREEFYRTLARNLPQSAVFLFDRDLRILAAEGVAMSALTFSSGALEGKLFSEVLESALPQVSELLRIFREALNGNNTRMERLYGDVFYRIHVLPVRNDYGDIIAGMALLQNIDEQKKSEEALRNSEERNRALINAMPDLMFVVKRDGKISDFRPSLNNEVSLPVATDTQTIRQVGLPDDIIDESILYIELALDTGDVQSFEYSQDEKPPKARNYHIQPQSEDELAPSFEVRMTALNDEEVLTLVRDITPLKRIQRVLKRNIEDLNVVRQVSTELSDNLNNFDYVVQLALDAAMRLSNAQTGFMAMKQSDESDSMRLLSIIGNYNVRQVNEVLQSESGIIWRVSESLEPELVTDLEHDPDYVQLIDDTAAIMVIPLISHERLVGILQLESRRLDRFNQERFEFLQLITGRIAAFLDNANLYLKTETQLAELKKLYDEVAYLVQLKTDMIRIASHDLRNPLGGISYYLQRLQANKDNRTEKQEGYLAMIGDNVKKMNRITKDILSLEKIDEMAQKHEPEVFDLKARITMIGNEQSDFAIRKDQNLSLNLPDEDVFVDGDEQLLHEAITNLVSNAIKYTPNGGNIEVKLRANERTGQAIVTVIDDGYGIPEDQQERLFSPFYRVTTRETSEIEGTGLGLHLVKNIIKRHDGQMIFESKYGEGSRFGFNIPLLSSPPLA